MIKYQGMSLLEAAPVIPRGEPLLQAEEVKMYLTAHVIKRLHDRFGFPEAPEQLLEILRSEFPEGWQGENERCCTFDFTTYIPVRIVAIEYEKKEYVAKTAIEREKPLILGGYERKKIQWFYLGKK